MSFTHLPIYQNSILIRLTCCIQKFWMIFDLICKTSNMDSPLPLKAGHFLKMLKSLLYISIDLSGSCNSFIFGTLLFEHKSDIKGYSLSQLIVNKPLNRKWINNQRAVLKCVLKFLQRVTCVVFKPKYLKLVSQTWNAKLPWAFYSACSNSDTALPN